MGWWIWPVYFLARLGGALGRLLAALGLCRGGLSSRQTFGPGNARRIAAAGCRNGEAGIAGTASGWGRARIRQENEGENSCLERKRFARRLLDLRRTFRGPRRRPPAAARPARTGGRLRRCGEPVRSRGQRSASCLAWRPGVMGRNTRMPHPAGPPGNPRLGGVTFPRTRTESEGRLVEAATGRTRFGPDRDAARQEVACNSPNRLQQPWSGLVEGPGPQKQTRRSSRGPISPAALTYWRAAAG